MKVGSAVLRAFPIPVAFFTRWMVATRGQRVVTIIPIGSIEFDFSILVLALLLAKGFISSAADESTANMAEMCGLLHARERSAFKSGALGAFRLNRRHIFNVGDAVRPFLTALRSNPAAIAARPSNAPGRRG